jgi:hypothetical protein
MSQGPSVIERAFELARGGSCRSIPDIRRALRDGGYESVEAHLAGSSLMKQLNAELGKHKRADKPE